MCAACVAQGIAYVGGALGGLQVMAARAKARRAAAPVTDDTPSESPAEPTPTPAAADRL